MEISVRNSIPNDIDFHNFDVVLHLAAIVQKHRRISKDDEYFRINRDLCLSVAKQAKLSGIKHFIFMSTVKVYGRFENVSDSWNEDSPCFPDDIYGKSKYEAEIELKKIEAPYFKISIIRTPIVYGPGVKANMLRLVRLVERCPILPFAGVNNIRYYTYVENLIGFIDRIIETDISGTFLVMDDMSISTTNLVTFLSLFLNRKIHLFKMPNIFIKAGFHILPIYFESLFGSLYLDNNKTKKLLNYSPPFSTIEGLQKMIRSYLKQKDESLKV